MTQQARLPRLDMLFMLEDLIQNNDGEFTERELWQRLPRKMTFAVFSILIRYLLQSRKISLDAQGKIGWIFYPDNGPADCERLFWRHRTRSKRLLWCPGPKATAPKAFRHQIRR